MIVFITLYSFENLGEKHDIRFISAHNKNVIDTR